MADQNAGRFVDSVPNFDGIGRSYSVLSKKLGHNTSSSSGGRRSNDMASADFAGGDFVPVPVALIMQLSPEVINNDSSSTGSSGTPRVSLATSALAQLVPSLSHREHAPLVTLPSPDDLASTASRFSALRSVESKAAAAAEAAASEPVMVSNVDFFTGETRCSAPSDGAKAAISSKKKTGHVTHLVERIFRHEQEQEQRPQQGHGGARLSKSEVESGMGVQTTAVFLGPGDKEHGRRRHRERAIGVSVAQSDIRFAV